MADAPNNRILRVLQDETLQNVLEACRDVHLDVTTVLDRIGDEQSTIHFPEDCVISTLATYPDGTSIEVANIGREGSTGLGPLLETPVMLTTNIVQIAGHAYAMDTDTFHTLVADQPEFRRAMLASTRGMFQQVMISNACNAKHTAEQRLARWLLTMSDRVSDRTVELTQDFFAQILGVRRATISEASSRLKRDGVIDYSRGALEILDRDGLHDASCECYDLVSDAYDQLLSGKPG